jgi:hypothetical protein
MGVAGGVAAQSCICLGFGKSDRDAVGDRLPAEELARGIGDCGRGSVEPAISHASRKAEGPAQRTRRYRRELAK